MAPTSAAAAGRVAFLDALESEVARAHERELRVAVTLVHDPASSHADVRAALEELCGVAYAVRPRAYAAVLPGLGRAEALGVLAKVEARCGARGIAIEAAHGETAVELFVRLVAGGRPPREADHR